MGIFDKIKDVASDVADKGQGVAKEQQLKFELRKLDSAVEEAYTALGKRTHELHEAGTTVPTELGPEIDRVREAVAARDARKAAASATDAGATDAEATDAEATESTPA